MKRSYRLAGALLLAGRGRPTPPPTVAETVPRWTHGGVCYEVSPESDAKALTLTRIGDTGRRGLFRLEQSQATGRPVFHLELPVDDKGWSPPDYAASLIIVDRLRSRGGSLSGLDQLQLRVRGLGPGQTVHVSLMEDDGTTWTAGVPVDSTWGERIVPLSSFVVGRGVLLPQGFPGEWNYWVGPAKGRGGAGDRPSLERLQLSLRPEKGRNVGRGVSGVEARSITPRHTRHADRRRAEGGAADGPRRKVPVSSTQFGLTAPATSEYR
ncbi:MAG: hypothetical protein ABI877_05535 [Gemmatimonadaceae bacterium]